MKEVWKASKHCIPGAVTMAALGIPRVTCTCSPAYTCHGYSDHDVKAGDNSKAALARSSGLKRSLCEKHRTTRGYQLSATLTFSDNVLLIRFVDIRLSS